MLRIMQDNGIWNMYSGTHRYEKAEILQVGEFNQEGKYWPAKVRINKRSGASLYIDVNLIRFSKDDFGQWVARCMNC